MHTKRYQPIFFLAIALVAAMAAAVFAAGSDTQGAGGYGRGWHKGAGDGPACLQNLSEFRRSFQSSTPKWGSSASITFSR